MTGKGVDPMPVVPKDRGRGLMPQSEFVRRGLRIVKERQAAEQQRRVEAALRAWGRK